MTVNETALAEHRLQAAEASGGTSGDAIYSTITRTLNELNLAGELLDFGAGTGDFTKRIASMGRFRSVAAADIMRRPEDLPRGVRWIVADLNASLDLPGDAFDVIVAAEVIEHLENPRAIAREWFRLLRQEGTLILSTPNNESWRSVLALLFQGHYALFGPASYPAHITALLRKDIERATTEAGFEPPVFLYTNAGALPKMGGLKWQTISGGLLRGVRYSDNLVAIAKKPKTHKGTARAG